MYRKVPYRTYAYDTEQGGTTMYKKAQKELAWLILVIGVLLVMFLLALPPEVRDKILGG